jgi:amino acid transporter
VIVAVLTQFSFDAIVQCDIFMACVGCLFEFSAFLYLKHKDPSPRPFVVPGGKVGAWIISLLVFPIVITTMALADWETVAIVGGCWAGTLVCFAIKFGFLKFREHTHKKKENSQQHEEAKPLMDSQDALPRVTAETDTSLKSINNAVM